MNHTPEWSHLLHPVQLQDLVRSWLREDTPSFDYGGYVVGEREQMAVLLCKSPGVLAGVPFFDAVFRELGCSVSWKHSEGEWLEPVTTVAEVKGKVRHLLLGERVALNCIARASGIASGARRLQQQAAVVTVLGKDGAQVPWHGQVAGTRKTTPGFRMVEKYALLVGGIDTHRYDLSSMIMLKDNHIWSAGNISQAVADARRAGGFSIKVEVECGSLQEGMEAAQAGAHVVMFDNFTPQNLHEAAAELKQKFPEVLVEASGGIAEQNLAQFCGCDVDIISLSRTTQGYDVVDFSLKILR